MNIKNNLFKLFIIIGVSVLTLFSLSNVLGNYGVTLTNVGASIRTTGNAGIKFVARIDDGETFPKDSMHGFFIAKGEHAYNDIINSINLGLEGEDNTLVVNGNKLVKVNVPGSDNTFSLVVTNLTSGDDKTDIITYTSDLTVLPYVQLVDGTYVFASDSCTRNIGDVAKRFSDNEGELIKKINKLVGGQYIDLAAEELSLNANVFVREDLTAGRSKYFINGKYQEDVKFYNSLLDAVNTDVLNPVIYTLDNNYEDEININKSLSLIGSGSTLNGGLIVNASNVKVSNFILGENITSSNAISDLIVEKCVFNSTNINLLEINGLIVEGCEFINVIKPISVSGSSSAITTSNNTFDYLNIEVDLKKYEVLNDQNGLYSAYVLNEVGADTIKVIVELNNNVLSDVSSIKINGDDAVLNEYSEDSYIIELVDERITEFDFYFDLSSLTFDHISDKYDVVVNRDSNMNIEIKATAKEGLEFSKRINVVVNDTIYDFEDISFSDTEIIITINVVSAVYITLNCLNLDPSDYNVSTSDYKYTVELIPDKPNYDYVYVVVTLNEGYEFDSNVKVYVNNKEVKEKMFVIKGNTLKYTQDDPNWTDIF